MKILMEGMSSMTGGLETFIMTVFRHMDHDKYQFDFLYYDDKIAYEDELRATGCGMHKVTKRSKNYFQYKKELSKLFSEGRYDVFWSNKTSLSAIEPFEMARRYRVNKIICHSHQSKNMGTAFTYVMHKINRARIGKYITNRFACSNVAAKWFFGNSKNVEIMRNAVNLRVYDLDDIKRRQTREKLGLGDELALCHIGRFAPEKNHDFLLDVFLKLLEKRKDAKLFLCGDGPLREKTEKKAQMLGIKDSVRFLGIRKDVPDLLRAFDILVFPSVFEGLPFVLVEAQAAALPCLVSDSVSQQTRLTDRLEFLPLSSETSAWVHKILCMLDIPRTSTASQMRARGYDVDRMVCRIEDLLTSSCLK